MILYKFLPPEIVDIIYLRTDFFTAIKHIPHRKFILEILFNRDISKLVTKGNWASGNRNHISICKILLKDCEASLRYFKERRPGIKLRDDMFKYNEECKIDENIRWNSLLISVYELKYNEILHFEYRHKRRFSHQRYNLLNTV